MRTRNAKDWAWIVLLTVLLGLAGSAHAADDTGNLSITASWQSGHYAEALQNAQARAVQGDANAEALLGRAYYEGVGVSRNYSTALYWLNKAVAQNNADAMFILGLMYEWGRRRWVNDLPTSKLVACGWKEKQQPRRPGLQRNAAAVAATSKTVSAYRVVFESIPIKFYSRRNKLRKKSRRRARLQPWRQYALHAAGKLMFCTRARL
jgi:hypothetical protein